MESKTTTWRKVTENFVQEIANTGWLYSEPVHIYSRVSQKYLILNVNVRNNMLSIGFLFALIDFLLILNDYHN